MTPTLHRPSGPAAAPSNAIPFSAPPSRRGRALLRVLLAALALGGIGVLAVAGGCGSLATDVVRDETLSLPKNAPFAAHFGVHGPNAAGDEVLAAHFPRAVPAGDGARRPIVFVHGTPDTMGAWAPLLFGPGALAGEEDVWTIEVVGHGMAASDAGPFPFQRCADYVASAIETLGLEDVTLVGNSYGAEFCWRAAVDRPDLVGKLVLIDSSGLPRADDEFLSEEVKMREWSVARFGYLLNSEPRVQFALDPHFEGGADPDRVREVFLGLENRGNWNAMIDLVRDENGERADDLARLAMPTLLVWGELDQAYPPATFGRTFEQRIADARLVVVEGAGHYPHEQDPARVATELLAFHREEAQAPAKAR